MHYSDKYVLKYIEHESESEADISLSTNLYQTTVYTYVCL